MMGFSSHLVMVPVVLPLLVGGLMLLLGERHYRLRMLLGVLSCLSLVVTAGVLMRAVGAHGMWAGEAVVYQAANWAAPFGIVLVLDRLSALLLMLVAVAGLCALVYATARWDRAGVHFHPLFQFLLMGLNGSFLTGDLFNLFVFFEVMLAASYGLVLHGSGVARVHGGMHYIVMNLAASSLFLIGVSLLYGVTGTLNMADMAERIPLVAEVDRGLLHAGAALLAVAFLVKAAVWPLNFWLVPAYSAACPPVAAIFALMTKVGVYVIIRLWLLLFGDTAGPSAGFGQDVLFYGGIATLIFGMVGMLAAQELPRMASYAVIVSSGTLILAVAYGDPKVTAGALFYLVVSTLAVAAMHMLIELIERTRAFGSDVLALTMEAFDRGTMGGYDVSETDEVGIVIPMAMAFLGLAFFTCAVLLAGLPPLSGFVAKFVMLSAALNPDGLGVGEALPRSGWLIGMMVLSGLVGVVAMSRAGIRSFWAPADRIAPQLRMLEVAPIGLLLFLCVVLTVEAGHFNRYLDQAAMMLHDTSIYRSSVLGQLPVPSPGDLP